MGPRSCGSSPVQGTTLRGVDFRFRDLVFEGSISSGAGVLSAPEILGEGARLGRLSSLGEVCAARLFPVKIWFLCQKTMSFCGGIQSCDMQVISVLKGHSVVEFRVATCRLSQCSRGVGA